MALKTTAALVRCCSRQHLTYWFRVELSWLNQSTAFQHVGIGIVLSIYFVVPCLIFSLCPETCIFDFCYMGSSFHFTVMALKTTAALVRCCSRQHLTYWFRVELSWLNQSTAFQHVGIGQYIFVVDHSYGVENNGRLGAMLFEAAF